MSWVRKVTNAVLYTASLKYVYYYYYCYDQSMQWSNLRLKAVPRNLELISYFLQELITTLSICRINYQITVEMVLICHAHGICKEPVDICIYKLYIYYIHVLHVFCSIGVGGDQYILPYPHAYLCWMGSNYCVFIWTVVEWWFFNDDWATNVCRKKMLFLPYWLNCVYT